MSLQANHYTQIKHDLQILQIHQKQGGVLTLQEARHLVPPGKQVAYQLPRTPGSLPSRIRVPRSLYAQDSTCRDRQHHSGVIHKQGRRHEVGPTLCFTMENLDLVRQKSSNSKSPTKAD